MNRELQKLCKSFHRGFKPKKKVSLVATWSEPDLLQIDHEYKKAMARVVIFATRGCGWALKSGCSMCGYFRDSLWGEVPEEELLSQLEIAMKKYDGEEMVKIFTSGSFLDSKEIPFKIQEIILEKISKLPNVRKVSIESKPEFVTDRIEKLSRIVQPSFLEISIGLESVNDFILENSINKGFSFNDWKKAAEKVRRHGIQLKTYLLIKPPFLTEKEAIEDCIESARIVEPLSTTISFNPVNIQRYTLVEYLWKRREYRPPWLWSIVEILKKVSSENSENSENIRLQCDVIAGGKKRGAHNCGKCDSKFLDAIKNFSLSQNVEVFNDLKCECKEEWLDQLELESFLKGNYFD